MRNRFGYSTRRLFPSNDTSKSKAMPTRMTPNGKSTLKSALGSKWCTTCKGDESYCICGNNNKASAPFVTRKSPRSPVGTTITSSGAPWEAQTTWTTVSCFTQTATDKSIANG